MKRADIARRRIIGDAARIAARFLGEPWTHEARAELGLSEAIYAAENGYGSGVGRATAAKAKREFDATATAVLEILSVYDRQEESHRAPKQFVDHISCRRIHV
jgi:hypothetical protein